jgi:hypothetical protein
MMPLAKLWTRVGNLFIPTAIVWALYIRNGFAEQSPSEGVTITRAYWGLLVTLLAACLLVWIAALYVRQAKRNRATVLIPPNTAFEKESDRNLAISWGTLITFILFILAGLAVFGSQYSSGDLYGWNEPLPLEQGFVASRIKAHQVGCASRPCFAVGQRAKDLEPIQGVNEYVLYWTDGTLVLFALILCAGLGFLMAVTFQRAPSSGESSSADI